MDSEDRRDAAQERYDDAYREAYYAADFAARIAYELEFDDAYLIKHPYKSDHKALHIEALRLLDQ